MVSSAGMAIRVSVKQEVAAKRNIITFTARLFEDLTTAEASSKVLTDFGVVFELERIDNGELLFDLVLVDSQRSIVAKGVTEEEVSEFVGERADYLGLGDALDAACETAGGWNVQSGLPVEDPYADTGAEVGFPDGAYNFQLRLHQKKTSH
jgi:hypothetical protein